MNILILSAGYGSRLSPLTDQIPKPMVQVGLKSILEIQIDLIKQNFPIANIIINTHHLAEKLESFAQTLAIDKVYHEEKILGTGGPLYRLYNDGYQEDLLVMNCDNYHNLDIKKFVKQSQNELFALLCIDYPKINSVEIKNNQVTGINKVYSQGNFETKKTFTGISYYSSEALSRINKNDFSVVNYWKREANNNNFPKAIIANNNRFWIDIGTPKGLYEASYTALRNNNLNEYIDKHATVNGIVNNSIIMKNSIIPTETTLKKCIVLPNSQVSNGNWEKTIFGEGFQWKI